jgi:twitching motility protein PilT
MELDIKQILQYMVDEDASDLHLIVGEPPTVRLHGRMTKVPNWPDLKPEDTENLCKQIITERSWSELEEERGADFGYTYEGKARFRVATFYQKHTIALSLRLIPYRLLSFDQIGLDDNVKQMCHEPRGLILVTGPTGSGKTTTLATMIDYINMNRDCHIITIEDPIEYYHNHKQSVVSQREVGIDVPSFDMGVIKALRQDPDVILVGEMRDLNTISAAVRAAETGHLVLSTLHTTGAARTVDRIVDVFPVDQQEQIRTQLAGNLKAVISQLLIPKKSGKGRVACFEVMFATPAIQHMIRDRKTPSITSAIQTGVSMGMKALDDSLLAHYKNDLIAREEMLRLAERPQEILEKLGEVKSGIATGSKANMSGSVKK